MDVILPVADQERLIKKIIEDHVGFCEPKNFGNYNFEEMKKYQRTKFYDQSVHRALRCIISSILAEDGVGGKARFTHIMNRMMKLDEGANGVVMKVDGKNLSRKGNFADFDKHGLMIAKLSKGDDEDIEREFVVGDVLNQLRDSLPHFALVYGLLDNCDSVFTDGELCSGKGTRKILLMEKINGPSFEKWLLNTADDADGIRDLFSIWIQLMYALGVANARFGYAHHDLHGKNVIIRELDDYKYIPLTFLDKIIFLKTKVVPTIIDFGYSRIDYTTLDFTRLSDVGLDTRIRSVAMGIRSFDDETGDPNSLLSALGPANNDIYYDIFRLFSVYPTILQARKGGFIGVFNTLAGYFPEEIRKYVPNHPNRHSLSTNQIKQISAQMHFFTFFDVVVQAYRSRFPADTAILYTQINQNFPNEYQSAVPLMACSDVLNALLEENPFVKAQRRLFNNTCELSEVAVEERMTYGGPPDTDDVVLLYDYVRRNREMRRDPEIILKLKSGVEKMERAVEQARREITTEKVKSMPLDAESTLQFVLETYIWRNKINDILETMGKLNDMGYAYKINPKHVTFLEKLSSVLKKMTKKMPFEAAQQIHREIDS